MLARSDATGFGLLPILDAYVISTASSFKFHAAPLHLNLMAAESRDVSSDKCQFSVL